jgi:hypothetical protein
MKTIFYVAYAIKKNNESIIFINDDKHRDNINSFRSKIESTIHDLEFNNINIFKFVIGNHLIFIYKCPVNGQTENYVIIFTSNNSKINQNNFFELISKYSLTSKIKDYPNISHPLFEIEHEIKLYKHAFNFKILIALIIIVFALYLYYSGNEPPNPPPPTTPPPTSSGPGEKPIDEIDLKNLLYYMTMLEIKKCGDINSDFESFCAIFSKKDIADELGKLKSMVNTEKFNIYNFLNSFIEAPAYDKNKKLNQNELFNSLKIICESLKIDCSKSSNDIGELLKLIYKEGLDYKKWEIRAGRTQYPGNDYWSKNNIKEFPKITAMIKLMNKMHRNNGYNIDCIEIEK